MPKIKEKLTAFAPAKVNLHLVVKDRRPDGFHDLESVFLAVDFGDTLHFQLVEGENLIEITNTPLRGIKMISDPKKNIIFKAVSLFKARTGFSRGLKVRLEKRIPIGGGLGGGSSNAAATLLALNKIAGFPLNREALLEMAAALGSDVPFFICETGAAWVTGRGEYISPIKAPRLFFVLVNPGFSSKTAAAFRLLDEYRSQNPHTGARGGDSVPPYLRVMNMGIDFFQNDFLDVFSEREKSVYNGIIWQLREQGALFAGLSGTGSTCFGVFEKKEQTQKAADALRGKWDIVKRCCSLYEQIPEKSQ